MVREGGGGGGGYLIPRAEPPCELSAELCRRLGDVDPPILVGRRLSRARGRRLVEERFIRLLWGEAQEVAEPSHRAADTRRLKERLRGEHKEL